MVGVEIRKVKSGKIDALLPARGWNMRYVSIIPLWQHRRNLDMNELSAQCEHWKRKTKYRQGINANES
jgi:hypothetical protein